LAPCYQGPYLVVSRGRKCFRLAIRTKVETISMDRLKPHTGEGAVEAAQPPNRDRPPTPNCPAAVIGHTPLSWASVLQQGCGQPPVSSASTPPVQRWGGCHVKDLVYTVGFL
jgi:hypothetical protein